MMRTELSLGCLCNRFSDRHSIFNCILSVVFKILFATCGNIGIHKQLLQFCDVYKLSKTSKCEAFFLCNVNIIHFEYYVYAQHNNECAGKY